MLFSDVSSFETCSRYYKTPILHASNFRNLSSCEIKYTRIYGICQNHIFICIEYQCPENMPN